MGRRWKERGWGENRWGVKSYYFTNIDSGNLKAWPSLGTSVGTEELYCSHGSMSSKGGDFSRVCTALFVKVFF